MYLFQDSRYFANHHRYNDMCYCIYRCCTGYGTTQKRKYCLLESESTAASIAIESAANIDTSKWIVSISTTVKHATHFCLIAKIQTLLLIVPYLIFLLLMRKQSCPAWRTVVDESTAPILKSVIFF